MTTPDLAALRKFVEAALDSDSEKPPAVVVAAADALWLLDKAETPVPMLLWCPACGQRHVDAGEFATKPHHTHACQHCGMVWRPALGPTVGVQFLPGLKDRGVL